MEPRLYGNLGVMNPPLPYGALPLWEFGSNESPFLTEPRLYGNLGAMNPPSLWSLLYGNLGANPPSLWSLAFMGIWE